MLKYKVVGVDFDNTLSVQDSYPNVGELNMRAISLLKDYKERGGQLILFTCRSDEFLTDAVMACKEHGLEFDAVNENVMERKVAWNLRYPGVSFSPKPAYDFLIDDRNAEAMYNGGIDWDAVELLLGSEE